MPAVSVAICIYSQSSTLAFLWEIWDSLSPRAMIRLVTYLEYRGAVVLLEIDPRLVLIACMNACIQLPPRLEDNSLEDNSLLKKTWCFIPCSSMLAGRADTNNDSFLQRIKEYIRDCWCLFVLRSQTDGWIGRSIVRLNHPICDPILF